MAVMLHDRGIVVTFAPGTGSTALQEWMLHQQGAQEVTAPGTSQSAALKHATVRELLAAGWERPAGVRVMTGTRNPFDHWAAEWWRSRQRWALELRDRTSWVNGSAVLRRRIEEAVEQPFPKWLEIGLASDAAAGTERHLNHGHISEADFVVRKEHLMTDARRVLPGVSGAPPRTNVTPGRRDYRLMFDPRSRWLVETVNRPDLTRFGYGF